MPPRRRSHSPVRHSHRGRRRSHLPPKRLRRSAQSRLTDATYNRPGARTARLLLPTPHASHQRYIAMEILVGLGFAVVLLYLWLLGHWFARVLVFLLLAALFGLIGAMLTEPHMSLYSQG